MDSVFLSQGDSVSIEPSGYDSGSGARTERGDRHANTSGEVGWASRPSSLSSSEARIKEGTPGGSRTITITVRAPKCTPPACADTSPGQAAMSPGLRMPPACSFSREKGGLEQDRTEDSHLCLRSGADESHNGLRASAAQASAAEMGNPMNNSNHLSVPGD